MKLNALIYRKTYLKEKKSTHPSLTRPVESQRNRIPQLRQLEDEKSSELFSLICPLCPTYLYKAISLNCGHMFCELCIEEYFLFKEVNQHHCLS